MARPPVPSGFICYHCGSDKTCKGGFNKGKRRLKCRGCGMYFIEGGSYRPPRKYKITDNTPSASHLILELQTIAQRIGRTPTTNIITELAKEGKAFHIHHYYAVFGSFLTALKRARIKLIYRQEFDEADRLKMLNQLRALSKKLKRPLFAEDVAAARKRNEVSPLNHFFSAFGLIPKAIELAGVAPKIIYTRAEMIAVLRKLDAKTDRPVQTSDIDELYRQGLGPSSSTLEKKFGGMAKTRKAAKIKNAYKTAVRSDKYWQRYTVEEVIAQLKALGEKLGRRPTDRDINKASGDFTFASSATVARMFGNLPNAYRAAGFENVKPSQYTDAEIISALRKLKKQLGRFPMYIDLLALSKEGKCPTPNTIARRLGRLRDLKDNFD